MEKTRTFIAVDFPDEVVKEVARVQGILRGRKFTGKLTELGNLHLTLKFLGEIDSETLNKVKKELGKIKIGKFEASLKEAGIFSYRKKPRIAWIKIGGKGMFDLQAAVDNAMEKCGFKKEERFMSHLTLARIKYVKSPDEFKEYVKNLKVGEIKFNVEEFKLMKSELREMGPVYETLKIYK
ncbi:MAG: RNA 2',3'-cyclic phosphodiesterase [Nanoarchaeota archaeon]|nr:RNA 2',3'-cyclic phosphodiesterase [Nanoarchaeota archaeon]MBU1051577.1 RNA 2',3'-cyclic phosphodiesterase [Nanoarchaeota archaeon]MBU1988668.1 RNA 2',3'-cyclic phosphodiesterase [Nanoarchaeota archaeon]